MRLKKLSGVVLAAVMTVGMCSTAFAADTELSNGGLYRNDSFPEWKRIR